MFIAAQFTVGKCWKQSKCPSVNEWNKKLRQMYDHKTFWSEMQKYKVSCCGGALCYEKIAESKFCRVFFEAPIGLEIISQKTWLLPLGFLGFMWQIPGSQPLTSWSPFMAEKQKKPKQNLKVKFRSNKHRFSQVPKSMQVEPTMVGPRVQLEELDTKC